MNIEFLTDLQKSYGLDIDDDFFMNDIIEPPGASCIYIIKSRGKGGTSLPYEIKFEYSAGGIDVMGGHKNGIPVIPKHFSNYSEMCLEILGYVKPRRDVKLEGDESKSLASVCPLIRSSSQKNDNPSHMKHGMTSEKASHVKNKGHEEESGLINAIRKGGNECRDPVKGEYNKTDTIEVYTYKDDSGTDRKDMRGHSAKSDAQKKWQIALHKPDPIKIMWGKSHPIYLYQISNTDKFDATTTNNLLHWFLYSQDAEHNRLAFFRKHFLNDGEAYYLTIQDSKDKQKWYAFDGEELVKHLAKNCDVSKAPNITLKFNVSDSTLTSTGQMRCLLVLEIRHNDAHHGSIKLAVENKEAFLNYLLMAGISHRVLHE